MNILLEPQLVNSQTAQCHLTSSRASSTLCGTVQVTWAWMDSGMAVLGCCRWHRSPPHTEQERGISPWTMWLSDPVNSARRLGICLPSLHNTTISQDSWRHSRENYCGVWVCVSCAKYANLFTLLWLFNDIAMMKCLSVTILHYFLYGSVPLQLYEDIWGLSVQNKQFIGNFLIFSIFCVNLDGFGLTQI